MDDFKKLLINGIYMKWLSDFTNKKIKFNTISILINNNSITETDKKMIKYLRNFYNEINLYQNKKGIFDLNYSCVKYNNLYYLLSKEKNYINCIVCDKKIYISNNNKWYATYQSEVHKKELPVIEYDDFIRSYSFEEKANINDINYLSLESLISNSCFNPELFYKNIYKNLSQNEINLLINDLVNKNCFNCTNCECPEDLSKIEDEEEFVCDNWENKAIIAKSRLLRINDAKNLF